MMAANSNSAFTLANNQSGGGHSSRRWGRVVRRNLSTEVIMDKRGDRGTEKDNNNDERRSAVSSVLKLNIQGRHLKVTESLRQYVEDQVTRAVSHFMHHHHDINKGRNSPISRTDVRLSTRGGPKHSTKGPQLQKAEVTVFTTIGVVRAEVETDHAYNSIDEACKTVERKLRKLKEKAIAKGVWNGHGIRQKKKDLMASKYDYLEQEQLDQDQWVEEEPELGFEWDTIDSLVEDVGAQTMSQKESDLNIYRKKEVDLIPMTIEDAVESLQFLGHDFFMFLDKETKDIKVVYRRNIKGYGVLTPVYPPSS